MRPQRMTMSPAPDAKDAPTLELLVTDKAGLLVGVVGIAEVPDAIDPALVGLADVDTIDDDELARPPRMTMSLASAALLPMPGSAPHLPTRRVRATEIPAVDDARGTPDRSRG